MKSITKTLDEVESKKLLRQYGVNATEPHLARTPEEATMIANQLGVPTVMKIVSAELPHKSAVGGVRLNVAEKDAANAYLSILANVKSHRPEADVRGVLVEPMGQSGLEIFVGGKRDADFGAILLVGQGGVNVERDDNVAASLAPISPAQANELATGLLSGHFLGADLERLSEMLARQFLALAGNDGLLLNEPVVELDVNPIIVTRDSVLAVDGLIILEPAIDAGTLPIAYTDRQVATISHARQARLGGMRSLFNPEAIAVVGVSTNTSKFGYRILANLVDFGFAGGLYPVHPQASEICGLQVYNSVAAIPHAIDRAIIAVPAADVPGVLKQCIAKGVKVAQVLTAGFSEWSQSGPDEGRLSLEKQLADVVKSSDMRMVGPNCVGTYSAGGRMPVVAPRYSRTEPGGITFISQSGTFSGDVARRATALGVPVGRVLSCGNCLDLDAIDYLLFCESDPETTLTAFYVESIRDPGLFFRLAAMASKPIVMLKGGQTSQGVAAASSHTAALASDSRLWQAGIAKSGIVEVRNMEEMMDVLLAYSTMGITRTMARNPGNKVGLFGSGGGVSVISADVAARVGLTFPPLSADTAVELQRFGVPGTSVHNPIDIPVWGLFDKDRYIFGDIIDFLKNDTNIDAIVVYLEAGSVLDFANNEKEGLAQLDAMCQSIGACRREGPPVIVALRSGGDQTLDDFVRSQRLLLGKLGMAVYPTTTRALHAQAALWKLAQRWGKNL